MTNVATGRIDREGASLYWERRGSGRAIVFIPGGPQDAGIFADISSALAGRASVITFDPRGNSRSPLSEAGIDVDVEVHAADVAALIDEHAEGSADVFGTSGGAQIAMALATRHPARVRSLVLHEAPAVHLLADPAEAIATDQAIVDTFREHGVEAGIGAFFGMAEMEGEEGFGAGEEGDGPPLDPEESATMERVMGNFAYFLGHGLMPLSLYRPNLETLRGSGIPVTVGVGAESTQPTMQAISERLAERLGAPIVTFPGDHSGFASEPEAFAEVLTSVLP